MYSRTDWKTGIHLLDLGSQVAFLDKKGAVS